MTAAGLLSGRRPRVRDRVGGTLSAFALSAILPHYARCWKSLKSGARSIQEYFADDSAQALLAHSATARAGDHTLGRTCTRRNRHNPMGRCRPRSASGYRCSLPQARYNVFEPPELHGGGSARRLRSGAFTANL